jgi:hypothetical protein
MIISRTPFRASLFYVEPEHQQAVRERLKGLIEVRVSVDYSGSKIVVYEPEGLAACRPMADYIRPTAGRRPGFSARARRYRCRPQRAAPAR